MADTNTNYYPDQKASTPYREAQQEWDNRIGSAIVRAKNWRFACFGLMGITALSVGGLIYQSSKSQVVPYVVEVDTLGSVRTVGAAQEPYTPSQEVVKHFLSRFVGNIRSLPVDPLVVRKQWLEAYDYVTVRAKNKLTAYAQKNDPFLNVGKIAVTVDITSIAAISDNSYQVQWKESVYDATGEVTIENRYSGVFTLQFQPPKNEKSLRANPLGMYVEDFNWSQQL